jgi:branched-chain amino acid transport system ATP-binding protein
MSPLSVEGISAGYAGTDILRDVSVSVAPGELLGVLGPNGAGKSTLLKVMSGQLRIRDGSRSIDGDDVKSWSPHAAARAGVRWVGEPRPIYPGLTVEENLQVGGITARAGIPKQRDRVYGLLPALYEKRQQRAGSLSGGQQQMLAIGQSLMSNPRYLCLDEPSLGLAPRVVSDVAALVASLVQAGMGAVWAEQFPELTRAYCNQLLVLSAGSTVAHGRPDEISDDDLERAYLGRARL